MGKLLNYLGESKILKRIADVLNVRDVKVDGVSVVDNNGDANIPATTQIQSDWAQTDNTQPDYIKNKPSTPAAQVQSDWNEDDTTDPAYIKNKPTIPAAQVNSDWTATSGVAEILHKPEIVSPNHSHGPSILDSLNQRVSNLDANTDYFLSIAPANGLTAGSITYPFKTPKDTTYSLFPGSINGTVELRGSDGVLSESTVKGLKSAAYRDISDAYDGTSQNAMSGIAIQSAIPTDFVPKSTGGTFDANVNIVTKHTQTTNVNSVISLGNNIPVGTAGTSRGILQLWSNTGKWVNFIPDLNPANVTLNLPMVSGTLALTSDISSMAVNWASNSILGVKNFVAYPYYRASGYTEDGITFTYNEEGWISVNGTATDTADFALYNVNTSKHLIESGVEYILSLERTNDLIYGILYFKDASGTNLTVNYSIEYENGDSETRNTYYVSLNRNILHTIAKFKILDAGIKCYSELRLRISNGSGPFVAANDKGRFMLRLAEDNDDTWQPYSMTNQELTEVLRGVPTTAGTYTLQATRNADNSITYSWV